jgi:hypothetical protein
MPGRTPFTSFWCNGSCAVAWVLGLKEGPVTTSLGYRHHNLYTPWKTLTIALCLALSSPAPPPIDI